MENGNIITELRKVLNEKIKHKVAGYDIKEEFSWEFVKELAPLGIWGIIFPKEYGGLGASHKTYLRVLEELGAIDPSLALTVESHNSLAGNTINMFGSDEQKKKYLVPMAKGEALGAWCLTEPESGSDAKSLKTKAEDKGDHWLLNGSKVFITQGSVAKYYVIFAVTKAGTAGSGISVFVAESGTPGLEIAKKEKKMGLRASNTTQLDFMDMKIPKENLIGPLNRGFSAAMKVLDAGRVAISGISLGIARASIEHAINRAKLDLNWDPQLQPSLLTPLPRGERLGEGDEENSAISEGSLFPSVGLTATQKTIADYASQLHAVRSLATQAAELCESGDKSYSLQASMAKLLSGELAVSASTAMMDMFGEEAFLQSNAVGKLFRDSKLFTIGEGTSEVQRRIIGKQLLADTELLK
ncbi:acyl-CoA dehydrogenase family protein [Elusimicrobiota bacterium]